MKIRNGPKIDCNRGPRHEQEGKQEGRKADRQAGSGRDRAVMGEGSFATRFLLVVCTV